MRTAMIYLLGMEYLGLNSLFSSILQILNLADGNLADHIGIFTVSSGYQHIFYCLVIVHLEEMISLHHLTVCRRLDKFPDMIRVQALVSSGCHQHLPFHAQHTQVDSRNGPQFIDCFL